MNVRDRLFPYYIITRKIAVSNHNLSISVPSDMLHIITIKVFTIKIFACRVVVSIAKNVIIIRKQYARGIYLRSGGKGL
jgi:hypothetical protein